MSSRGRADTPSDGRSSKLCATRIARSARPWTKAVFPFQPVRSISRSGPTRRRWSSTWYEPCSHEGDLSSFDMILRLYEIRDPALYHLAVIVRGADTARPELAPEAPGLLALSLGLSANFQDDHAMLQHGLTMYDAFYAWCRSCQDETHNWTPKAA